MNAIASRLQRLESAQRTADVQPWRWIELRSVGDDQWRDDDGTVGTLEDLEARHDGNVIFVRLRYD